MRSKLSNDLMAFAPRRRLAPVLAVLALLLAAGCGGGGGQGQAATDGNDTTAKQDDEPAGKKPKVPRGGVVKSFEIKVTSPSQATLTTTLTKASPLALQVKRIEGAETLKVGRVSFGNKPAGTSTISWNLTAAGKKLTPGQYRVVLRAGTAGKSAPKTITVPDG